MPPPPPPRGGCCSSYMKKRLPILPASPPPPPVDVGAIVIGDDRLTVRTADWSNLDSSSRGEYCSGEIERALRIIRGADQETARAAFAMIILPWTSRGSVGLLGVVACCACMRPTGYNIGGIDRRGTFVSTLHTQYRNTAPLDSPAARCSGHTSYYCTTKNHQQ